MLGRHQGELLAIPGVTGIAKGRCGGGPCIKVYIARKTLEIAGKIPFRIEGFPVSVEETGEKHGRTWGQFFVLDNRASISAILSWSLLSFCCLSRSLFLPWLTVL